MSQVSTNSSTTALPYSYSLAQVISNFASGFQACCNSNMKPSLVFLVAKPQTLDLTVEPQIELCILQNNEYHRRRRNCPSRPLKSLVSLYYMTKLALTHCSYDEGPYILALLVVPKATRGVVSWEQIRLLERGPSFVYVSKGPSQALYSMIVHNT